MFDVGYCSSDYFNWYQYLKNSSQANSERTLTVQQKKKFSNKLIAALLLDHLLMKKIIIQYQY